ncbi:MAG: transcription antitermination factor NusB [Candidatus Omnitrophica bacterium]|nr:transcription antitermination factor NusB [Candidatus Omnitrophota bacterium]
MRKRTRARECALKVLYQLEMTGQPPEEALRIFWETEGSSAPDDDLQGFAADLVRGAHTGREAIDTMIARYAANWQIDRMAVIDRNILRIGSYELKHREDIPPKVSINEAVELAKKYSGQEAGKFVNAILDKIRIELNR